MCLLSGEAKKKTARLFGAGGSSLDRLSLAGPVRQQAREVKAEKEETEEPALQCGNSITGRSRLANCFECNARRAPGNSSDRQRAQSGIRRTPLTSTRGTHAMSKRTFLPILAAVLLGSLAGLARPRIFPER